MAQKGSSFEREICKKLSLWWTQDIPGGPRDDVFWRTAGSGARATTRAKRGRATANSHGDITATDPVGRPLLDLITFECKKGYSKHSFADSLDKHPRMKTQLYEGWMQKAVIDAAAAGSFSWAVIAKRDQRLPVIYLPRPLMLRIFNAPSLTLDSPTAHFRVSLGKSQVEVVVCLFDNFLKAVSPSWVASRAALFRGRK